nr:MAG TPA: hypothetical protein [Caudoviricetes sp.]
MSVNRTTCKEFQRAQAILTLKCARFCFLGV